MRRRPAITYVRELERRYMLARMQLEDRKDTQREAQDRPQSEPGALVCRSLECRDGSLDRQKLHGAGRYDAWAVAVDAAHAFSDDPSTAGSQTRVTN